VGSWFAPPVGLTEPGVQMRAMPAGLHPEQIAAGVHRVAIGWGVTAANIYFVQSGTSWMLIDTAWPHRAEVIKAVAEALFGPGTRPTSIVLTHTHPDHAGSALALAETWEVAVYVHPDEMPLVGGEYRLEYSNPLDRWLVAPVMRVVPRRITARAAAKASLTHVARPLAPTGPVPGLPDWDCIPTPGHTPGHVALFRENDRVLITGDAVLTVNLNSLGCPVLGKQQVSGPPYISTWSWPMAKASVAALARLEPQVLAPGHGSPMTGAATALRHLAERQHPRARHRETGPVNEPSRGEGFLTPVDYARRTRYRRPPETYRRVSGRLGPLLTSAGLSPRDVITLEVPGRRSGVVRRTVMVRVDYDGDHYVVALAGESDWVRNVRAAGGRVVVGRGERHAARLVEVPPEQRAPVIRAYLVRWGRSAGSRVAAREARHFFGVSPDPSLEEIAGVVEHYPVFRISYGGPPDRHRGWGR